MSASRNQLLGSIGACVLIALVLFLAVDIGYRLYQPPKSNSQLPYCTLTIFSGTAKVQALDSIGWKEAKDGMTLEAGSRVRTVSDSYALLTFFEGTTTKLEPNTDLTVARLAGERINEPNVIVLRQWSGKTWNQVTKLADNSYHFEMATPSAEAMVRGTLFLTEVDKLGKTVLKTNEGQVDVTAQGQQVDVMAGQQTEVQRARPPSAPVPIPPPQNELVFTVDGPAVARIVDPSGSTTGYLPDGSVLNQITGSEFLLGEKNRIIRIPELKAGDYTAVLYGFEDGVSRVTSEVLTEGRAALKHTGSFKFTAASERLLNIRFDVSNGLVKGIRVVELKGKAGQPVVDNRATGNRTETYVPENGGPSGSLDDNSGPWRLVAGLICLMGAIVVTAKLIIRHRQLR